VLTLSHAPQSRSIRPRWLLEEIGAPYDLIRIDLEAGDHRKPEYLKINPNGAVPTLVDGDLVLFESAAIVQYLADKFPEKRLAPPLGTAARGKYYQWIHYAMNTLEPPTVTIFLHTTGSRPGRTEERLPQLVPPAREQLDAALKVVDDELVGKEFILGDQFSAADVMIGTMLGWCAMQGLLGAGGTNVHAYLGRLATRPAVARAQAD